MIRRHSAYYNFVADPKTGYTARWGATFAEDPLRAPWPELADIAISNYCTKNCSYCYRNSSRSGKFMSKDEYELVLTQLTHPSWGPVFQVAIGGGEPLEHPEFLEILEVTVRRGIVFNFTTNGELLSERLVGDIAGKVGAVALSISDISELSQEKLALLSAASVRTNVHFILSRNSLRQALEVVDGRHNELLSPVNAIIFLTHKPTGRARASDSLLWSREIEIFLKSVDASRCSKPIGFDACAVPLLLHSTQVDSTYIDPCECGFFSIFVDENLSVSPCSFNNNDDNVYSLHHASFEEIWIEKLEPYRRLTNNDCQRDCARHSSCKGKCPLFSTLPLCYSSNCQGALLR